MLQPYLNVVKNENMNREVFQQAKQEEQNNHADKLQSPCQKNSSANYFLQRWLKEDKSQTWYVDMRRYVF